MNCRNCGKPLKYTFLDLGFAPLSNAYLTTEELTLPEKHYPLKTRVCDRCWLVQTEDYARVEELFRPDYPYFSSTSASYLAHAAEYVDRVTQRLGLGRDSLVIEIGSNDGYLLKNFLRAGIPCLGIEPTESTAEAAERLGIPVRREFFGEQLGQQFAAEGKRADLIVGNNVIAHVPDISDFTRGLVAALRPGGTITLEFPDLSRLIEHTQFDTVYHEHFSYLSLYTVSRIFKAAGLRIWDVEEMPTHGGSLRVFGCHEGNSRETSSAVIRLLSDQRNRHLRTLTPYQGFQARADKVKDYLLMFLIEQKRAGKIVVGYGAAAKGNTLLNYAGVKPDLLPFICDAGPAKQGKFMPGSHIPILPPTVLQQELPDFVLILPWNIAAEVRQQNAELTRRGVRFVTAVPKLEIL